MPLYMMPIIGVGTEIDPRHAKYDSTFLTRGFSVALMDYGLEPVGLVFSPCDTATNILVVANADVFRLPDDLDTSPNVAQVTAIQTRLEAWNLPAHWVTVALTWRTILRTVMAMFQFMQRFHAVSGLSPFAGGVNLDRTFSSLGVNVRQSLIDTAASLNFDTTGITGSMTLRVILKNVADQWGTQPLIIGGQSI